MSSFRPINALFLSLCVAFYSILSSFSQSGITTEGPLTVLRTGGAEPLITFEAPLGPIPADADLLLEFDYGFSTSEPASPGTFFDSFSLTLQNTNSVQTALLATVDRDGVRWAPPNPGGLDLLNEDLRHNPIPFPDLSPSHLVQFAFHVVLAIPRALTGGPLTLFADLFDNANSFPSLAFISGVTVRPNATPLRLQSASEAGGPYQDETPLAVTQDAITVSNNSDKRFYRFSSARPTRILEQRIFQDRVILDYRYEPLTGLRLQGSTSVGGPFVDVTNAAWNPTNRTFTVPQNTPFTSFRVAGDHLAIILRTWTVGANVVIEYLSALIELRSSTVLGQSTSMVSRGPDQAAQTFRVTPNKTNEFFQVRSDVRTSIALRREGQDLVITYEVLP